MRRIMYDIIVFENLRLRRPHENRKLAFSKTGDRFRKLAFYSARKRPLPVATAGGQDGHVFCCSRYSPILQTF